MEKKQLMNEEEKILTIESTEDDDNYNDSSLFTINSWGADLSFRELANMYEEDELQKPDLQRHYVWDKREASRFIESILLGLPVPSIFLASTIKEDYLIVDGYQRIMTVYDFFKKGVFSKDETIFKLTGNVNERWRNKTFSQLDITDQKRIKRTTIHAIIFEQKKPTNDDTSMYQIFERINTGGRTLSPQEIRNCVYHNDFNQLLFYLNKLTSWRRLYSPKKEDFEPRMKDMEYILRFLMLGEKVFTNNKSISLKKELNIFMDMNQNGLTSDDLSRFKSYFNDVMEIFAKTDNTAFQNIKNNIPMGKLHPTIFDSLSIAILKAIKNNKEIKWIGNKNEFRRRKLRLLQNKKYDEYLTIRTTNIESINGRIELAYQYLIEDK